MIRDNSLGSRIFDKANLVILVLLGLLCILPIWYTLCVSLSNKASVAAGAVALWPIGFNFSSYSAIMADSKFWHSFLVSVERVVLGGGLNMIVIILMAYPLSKSKSEFPLRNVFMWILVFTMLFNGGLIPWFITVKSLGLLDTIWALVLSNGVGAFNVILLVNFYRNIPKELEEAALVDGAGPWHILFKIYIPISIPVLATVGLFVTVYHWNEFFNGLVLMSRPEHYPLQTYIQQLVVTIKTGTLTQDEIKKLDKLSNQTLNAAKIFIAMIPVLMVYPFLQRYFVTGIMLGSVKE